MQNFSYFKITFISIFAGLFVGVLVYESFDVNFSNTEALLNMFKKAFFVAFIVGLLMGILNMIFKIEKFKQKPK